MTNLIGVSAVLALLSVTPAGQGVPLVSVERNGKVCVTMQPRPTPPQLEGQQAGACYLFDEKDVRDQDGDAVTGYAFYPWNEGSKTVVRVFSLVPAAGAPNRYLANPGDDPEKTLRLKRLADYTISPGRPIPIDEMKKAGLAPMIMRLDLNSPPTVPR
jgi:hypothetical protein